jgi:hypothetical protein
MPGIESTIAGVATAKRRVRLPLQQFLVFDGSTRVVVEARNAEDARCLCNEMGWELICACDD